LGKSIGLKRGENGRGGKGKAVILAGVGRRAFTELGTTCCCRWFGAERGKEERGGGR